MSSDLEHPSGSAATNDYDGFAEAYAAETESNLINGATTPGQRCWIWPET